MPFIKKYIITGAPGTGKTTLIEALRAKGYPCIEEVSRKVILKEQEKEGDGTPWQNLSRFVGLVYDASINALKKSPEAIFTDRGLPDMIAYLKQGQLETSENLANFPFHAYYHPTIFYTPIWEEIYVTDPQRPTSIEVAKELETELLRTYASLGFNLTSIPFGKPSERADFIVTQVGNLKL